MTNEDNPLQYLAKCKHELLQKVLVAKEKFAEEIGSLDMNSVRECSVFVSK